MPYGQDAVLGIAFQNSRGDSASVNSMYPMPFLSENVVPQYPELLSQNMEGRYDEGEAYSGARQVAGTIVSEAQPITVGVILKALCGDPTSVQSAAIYTHTFQPRASDFSPDEINQPMTIYKNMADGGQVPIYDDCIAVGGQFRIANGELLEATMNVVGGNVGTKTTSQDIGTAVGRKWPWDVSSLELGGAANTDFADITVSIDEQSSPRWTVRNSRDPNRVKRDARRMVRVTGSVKFEDQTEYDIFLNGSLQVLALTLTSPTEIQSGYFDVFKIEIPSFKYLAYPAAFEDPSELIVGFEGKAEYNVGSATSVEFTLVNTQAAF